MNLIKALSALSLLLIIGCHASPAPDTGFIKNSDQLTEGKKVPFQKVWVKPGVNINEYKTVYIRPINTQYLLKMDWMEGEVEGKPISDEFKGEIAELALYTRKQIITAFKQEESNKLEVVLQPQPNTLILEMAIIEAIPSNKILGATALIPHIATKALNRAANDTTAAFEARVRDGGTNEVIAAIADRERSDIRPIDATKLEVFGPVKSIVDTWAEQFVQVANKKPDEVIEDPIPFTLKPW